MIFVGNINFVMSKRSALIHGCVNKRRSVFALAKHLFHYDNSYYLFDVTGWVTSLIYYFILVKIKIGACVCCLSMCKVHNLPLIKRVNKQNRFCQNSCVSITLLWKAAAVSYEKTRSNGNGKKTIALNWKTTIIATNDNRQWMATSS